jgi:hypothetical protein
LQGLTPTDSTDYSLWKVTKKIKQITKSSPPLRTPQGIWARTNAQKSHAFAKHLEKVLQLHLSENIPEKEEDIIQLLETPYQLQPPMKSLKIIELQEIINRLNPKKKNHQGTTSSPEKSSKNRPLLEFNILHSCST